MTRRLTCPACGAAPGVRCRARGGQDNGKPLAVLHDGRPEAGTTGWTGRPRALTDEQVQKARGLRNSGKTASQIAGRLGVSRATVYRYLREPPE